MATALSFGLLVTGFSINIVHALARTVDRLIIHPSAAAAAAAFIRTCANRNARRILVGCCSSHRKFAQCCQICQCHRIYLNEFTLSSVLRVFAGQTAEDERRLRENPAGKPRVPAKCRYLNLNHTQYYVHATCCT